MNTAEINITALALWILGGLAAIAFFFLKFYVERYFKMSDEKTKDSMKWQKDVLAQLSNMNTGLHDVNVKHINMLEKITRTEVVLEATVKEVGKLQLEVGILNKMNNINK